jgi:transposase InsO family protein
LVLFITSPRVSLTYTPEERTKLTNLRAIPGSQGWLLLSAQVSPQGTLKPPPSFSAHQLCGCIPGEDWQVYFTNMSAHKKLKYILTLVDIVSGWVEAFPTMGESAEVVSTHLIKDIIPQFGLPQTLQADNGLEFISKVTNCLLHSRSNMGFTHSLSPVVGKSGKNEWNN